MKDKIENLLNQLTLEQKASLCSGCDFWNTRGIEELNIPSIKVSDGPHGVRKEMSDDDNIALKTSYPSTCFPTASCTASSWNPDILYKMGEALADECLEQEIATILGPGVNLKRSSLCGRNFEYFSEDPVLSSKLGAAVINGIESKGIGTSLKHYAANNGEFMRMTINEIIDMRTLRETYLRVYEDILKESSPATVMCAYNKINSEPCSDSKFLLTDILRDKFNFKGLVISDWGATNNRVEGIKAGMDLEMPYFGEYNNKSIIKAVNSGKLSIEELDTCVRRILEYVFKYDKTIKKANDNVYLASYEKNHNLARKIAGDSMVLLKNKNDLLPLNKKEKITVLGSLAKTLRHQGTGSSRVNSKNLVSFIDFLNKNHINYNYGDGYTLNDSGFSKELIDEAVKLASDREKVIIVAGLTDTYESESFDRKSIIMPQGQVSLIEEIAKVNSNIIVVLFGGSVVEMPWINNVNSILNAFLPGEAGGEAIGDIIFGTVNPSGKLAETYPYTVKDNLADKYFGKGPVTVEYRESIFIGYKYYDTAKKDVVFPFGYGLSYTTFDYRDVELSSDSINEGDALNISFTLTNSGEYDGAEISQIYVKDIISTVFRPEKELCAFKKTYLKKGESKRITIDIPTKSFQYFNTEIDDWHIESGEFSIILGRSSRDFITEAKVYVKSANENAQIPNYRNICPSYYNLETATEINDSEFQALYGKPIPPNEMEKKGQYTMNSTMYSLSNTFIGKIFAKIAPKVLMSQIKNADQTTILAMQSSLREIPIRALCGMSGGLVSYNLAMGIVVMANGKNIRGFFKLLNGLFSTLKALNNKRIEDKKKAKIEKEKANTKKEKQLLKLKAKEEKKEEKQLLKAEKANFKNEKANQKIEKVEEKKQLKAEKAEVKKTLKTEKIDRDKSTKIKKE